LRRHSIIKRWMAARYLPGTRYQWQSRKMLVRHRRLDGGQHR
jgi:hypothetical protein